MASYMIKYKVLKLLALCAVVCISCTPALAGGANAPADANMVSDKASLEQRLTKKISVEFRKTAIEDVLRIMADQADIDIVKSPKVEGEVTVTLTDVPLEEALNNILSVHGFTYVLSQNMIRVITTAEQVEKPEQLQTKTFEIVYADVTEVVKALEKFKSPKGSVSNIKGTSHVIVTDGETKMRDITLFIERVDQMTQQVLVEVRIYDVTTKESFDLGVDWHVGRNVPITEINRTKTVDKTGKTSTGRTITSNDTKEGTLTDVRETGPTSTTEDTRTKTYDNLVDEVNPATDDTVNEVITKSGTPGTTVDTTTSKTTTGDDTTRTTTAGTASKDNVTETTAGTWLNDSFRKSRPFVGGEFDQNLGGTLTFGLLNDAVDLQLALNLLHQQIGAKLLANPRILVLDNETAKFKIVSEIPYQQLNQGGGTSQSFGTTQFKDVGVTLEVTPHIAARDKMVRLKLKPSFSVKTGTVDVGDPSMGIKYPQPVVDSRDADTTLLIKDGTTVVLGGLRKSEVTQDIRKVPLLGDLPGLRKLFRSETESTTTSELIVFITTRIIEEPAMTADEQQVYEVTKFKGPSPGLTRAEKKAKE